MDVAIYTYSNPYEIREEPFYSQIKGRPHFCVSQTMVNGLRAIYQTELKSGQITTIEALLENIYHDWKSSGKAIKQHAALDNIIRYSSSLWEDYTEERKNELIGVMVKNRQEIFNTVRTLIELDISFENINSDKISEEQKIIVKIFDEAVNGKYREDFLLREDLSEEEIDDAIRTTLTGPKQDRDISGLDFSAVIIHGIHQFSPLMLRAIEEIRKYRPVIFIFNYQKQYSQIYQTWNNVYAGFNSQIMTSPHNEFRPTMANLMSYEGNVLADQIGQLLEGNVRTVTMRQDCKIIEFDNITEFANYVAERFQNAEIEQTTKNTAKLKKDDNPLHYMKEQFYAADMRVNDILRIYFPKQFGERQFLDYPIGHFFLSITNMWDIENGGIRVDDLNDIRECLSAGVIPEDQTGELATLFNDALPLFTNCRTLQSMIKALKKVKRNTEYETDENPQFQRISYYHLTKQEMDKLIQGLQQLDMIARMFYDDFEDQDHNFKDFYVKMKNFLQDNVLGGEEDLDDDFRGIVKRVLKRIDEVKDIDTKASFECLRSTMSIYLQQESAPGTSARWIVKGFNQIDGDILQSNTKRQKHDPERIYHFACLSDEDMQLPKKDFSWPLDYEFFGHTQSLTDWKVQVYMNSRREARNFNRYALLYGLEFNRVNYRLSYIKHDQDREKHYLYSLKVLGITADPYVNEIKKRHLEKSNDIIIFNKHKEPYKNEDLFRYRVCRYKFLLESVIEGNTVYKDDFMLLRYFEVLLENRTRFQIQNKPKMGSILKEYLDEGYDELKKYFPFAIHMNKIDIVNKVEQQILNQNKKNNKFPKLNENDYAVMHISELFIKNYLTDKDNSSENIFKDFFVKPLPEELSETFSDEALQRKKFSENVNRWCDYCSNRGICLAPYQKM